MLAGVLGATVAAAAFCCDAAAAARRTSRGTGNFSEASVSHSDGLDNGSTVLALGRPLARAVVPRLPAARSLPGPWPRRSLGWRRRGPAAAGLSKAQH